MVDNRLKIMCSAQQIIEHVKSFLREELFGAKNYNATEVHALLTARFLHKSFEGSICFLNL